MQTRKNIQWYHRILSYLFPISILKKQNKKHAQLSLQIYCNQLMLSTGNAVYSYGTFYTPFRVTFKKIKHQLPKVNTFLMLGTGLGSALKILQDKYHIYPISTLVDFDEDVIQLSKTYMQLNERQNVEWHYADALLFMEQNQKQFDLICVDVFRELYLPVEYRQESFFSLCKNALNHHSYCIFNMILASPQEQELIEEKLHFQFKEVLAIKMQQNVFFICKN